MFDFMAEYAFTRVPAQALSVPVACCQSMAVHSKTPIGTSYRKACIHTSSGASASRAGGLLPV